MITAGVVETIASCASRRTLYRRSKRVLSRLLARAWTGRRSTTLDPAVRRFLRGKPQAYLARILGSAAFAHAAALLIAAPASALPPVELSEVEAGNGGGFVINGYHEDGESGWSVSVVGDMNGDGLADLIVGAPHRGSGNDVGKGYVVFGKTDGTPVNLGDVVAGNGGFVINGVEPQEYSGFSVSGAGDVNGDGRADVIIGAPYAYARRVAYGGESYVVFGKADGTPVNLADVAAGNGGFVINGIAEGDNSGTSVSSAGDVNGDALDDVIVGAPYAGNGTSYVVFGKADGTPVDLADVVTGNGGFVINGGSIVSGAGDVNGDSFGDVILGDPYGTAGASYVVFGKADGVPVDIADIAAGNGGFVINGANARVSGAGDVNGDPFADVIIGAPAGAGKSYVVFGKADGAPVNLPDVAAGSGGFVINGIDARDNSGGSVSGAGDVNGDSFGDVIIGAPGAYGGGGTYGNAGESYVVFGKADGTPVSLSDVAAGNGGFVINGAKVPGSHERSGFSVSGGDVNGDGQADSDVNGDGRPDVIVGAPGARPRAKGEDAGQSYVVFSPAVGDVNGDGIVGIGDLLLVRSNWGDCAPLCPPACPADVSGDCTVGFLDLLLVLSNWTP